MNITKNPSSPHDPRIRSALPLRSQTNRKVRTSPKAPVSFRYAGSLINWFRSSHCWCCRPNCLTLWALSTKARRLTVWEHFRAFISIRGGRGFWAEIRFVPIWGFPMSCGLKSYQGSSLLFWAKSKASIRWGRWRSSSCLRISKRKNCLHSFRRRRSGWSKS